MKDFVKTFYVKKPMWERERTTTRTTPKTYLMNYILLEFIVWDEYYKDYDHAMETLGIRHFSEKQWIRVIEWISPEVEKKMSIGALTRLAKLLSERAETKRS